MRLLNRRFEVFISLAGPRADSTLFAVELMAQLIDNHSGGLYDQFVSHEELKRRLRCAGSPAELIEVARSLGAED